MSILYTLYKSSNIVPYIWHVLTLSLQMYTMRNMSAQQTIQIRIDKKTKDAAKKTLQEMGLDMSSAVKLFLTNVVNTQSIPLDLRTANGFTLAQERAMIAETEEAKKTGKKFATVEDLMKDLDN